MVEGVRQSTHEFTVLPHPQQRLSSPVTATPCASQPPKVGREPANWILEPGVVDRRLWLKMGGSNMGLSPPLGGFMGGT